MRRAYFDTVKFPTVESSDLNGLNVGNDMATLLWGAKVRVPVRAYSTDRPNPS